MFKLELIEYYEAIKNTIDLKTQTLIMMANEPGKASIAPEELLNLNDEFNQKCDQILNKNVNSLNSGGQSMRNLTCDCIFITESYTKLKNEIGLLIISDWFMSENEKAFFHRLFQFGSRHSVPVTDERDEVNDDELTNLPVELEFNEKVILIKRAYDTYLKNQSDILYVNQTINEKNVKNKFEISGFIFSSFHAYSFVNYSSLTHLYLSGNRINCLKSGMFETGLANLKNLDLFACSIKTVEINAFAGLGNLLSLNLGHNSQIDLHDPRQFNGLTSLKILNVSDNDFQKDINELKIFQNLKNLVMLDLALCTLGSRITESLFTGLEKLTTLDITHCLIENIEPNSFRSLKNLCVLEMQFNHFATIDKSTFEHLVNLQKLHIQECSIVKIEDDSFNQQAKLIELNLSANDLELLNENSFNGLTNLRELCINYRLDTGIKSFSNLKSLKSLNFHVRPDVPARTSQEISKIFNLDQNIVSSRIIV